jgi:hypothetical protein
MLTPSALLGVPTFDRAEGALLALPPKSTRLEVRNLDEISITLTKNQLDCLLRCVDGGKTHYNDPFCVLQDWEEFEDLNRLLDEAEACNLDEVTIHPTENQLQCLLLCVGLGKYHDDYDPHSVLQQGEGEDLQLLLEEAWNKLK